MINSPVKITLINTKLRFRENMVRKVPKAVTISQLVTKTSTNNYNTQISNTKHWQNTQNFHSRNKTQRSFTVLPTQEPTLECELNIRLLRTNTSIEPGSAIVAFVQTFGFFRSLYIVEFSHLFPAYFVRWSNDRLPQAIRR